MKLEPPTNVSSPANRDAVAVREGDPSAPRLRREKNLWRAAALVGSFPSLRSAGNDNE